MNSEDEVCYCGIPMKEHHIWSSCTSPQVNPQIHNWMKPFIEEFGMDPYVVRILGREGIAEDILEALYRVKDKFLSDGVTGNTSDSGSEE